MATSQSEWARKDHANDFPQHEQGHQSEDDMLAHDGYLEHMAGASDAPPLGVRNPHFHTVALYIISSSMPVRYEHENIIN